MRSNAAYVGSIDRTDRLQAMLGLSLLPAQAGKGYGTECVKLLLDFCFKIRGFHRVGLDTQSDNFAMQKVAEKFMQPEGRTRQAFFHNGRWNDSLHYGILASEWVDRH